MPQCHKKSIGKHLDLIKANKTSSGALRPTFPKIIIRNGKQPESIKNRTIPELESRRQCVRSRTEPNPNPTFTGFEPHITKPEQNRTLTIKKPEPKQTQNLRFPISNCNLPLACKNPSDFRLFLLCHIDLPPRLLVYSINFTWCSNLQRKESLPFKQ